MAEAEDKIDNTAQALAYAVLEFEKQYSAAESIEDSTELLSSQEIIELFSTIVEVEKNTLFISLRLAGYVPRMVNGHFFWLLKER